MPRDMRNDTSLGAMIGHVVQRHARLSILRYLAAAPGYKLNSNILSDILDRDGMCLTFDSVELLLEWLGAELFLEISRGENMVARLTDRGMDIAVGRGGHQEIERPRPSARPIW